MSDDSGRSNAGKDPRLGKADKLLAASAGFTGLWALTWLGSSVMGAGAATQGAFGAGTVMGTGGLGAMWWKMRALRRYQEQDAEDEASADDSHVGRAHKG